MKIFNFSSIFTMITVINYYIVQKKIELCRKKSIFHFKK